MNQPYDISTLVEHLKDILATQNLLSTTSNASTSNPSILPTTRPSIPASLRTLPSSSRLRNSLSTTTGPLQALIEHLQTTILPSLNHASLSPNYYGFITGGVTPAALLTDWLVSTFDQNVHIHLPSETVATELEAVTVGLLRELFCLNTPAWEPVNGGGGLITTGATASNILGLACAREWVLRVKIAARSKRNEECELGGDSVGEMGLVQACALAGVRGVKVLSTLPHSSVKKAAAVVGIGRKNVVVIGMMDDDSDGLKIDVDKFDSMTDDPEWAYVLVVSAGEVNTGRFATGGMRHMQRLRDICDRKGIWIHVDAAFGLYGRVMMHAGEKAIRDEEFEEIVNGVEGIELADSITADGHKLLNVPYDSGMFFTRHGLLSEDVFGNRTAEYLTSGLKNSDKSNGDDEDEPKIQSQLNIGIENSRRFRALPVWATLMAYGSDGYVDMLRRQVGLARKVSVWMRDSGRLEVLPKCANEREMVRKTFMIVLFRAKDRELNEMLVRKINGTGEIYVSGTKWDGLPAARIAVSNWQADIERDFTLIKKVLQNVWESHEKTVA